MKVARIVLDTVRPPPLEWCWREDWFSGLDSAYGLLMKFATLNVLSAREIAKVFISTKCGKRTAMCLRPDVDLRDLSVFDIDILQNTFKINRTQARFAFLYELLPNSKLRSSEVLRWCEQCMSLGFHTSVFQVAMAAFCPIHRIGLRSACSKCNEAIPYRLRTDVFSQPFCCPHCSHDMAPGLRRHRRKILVPRVGDRNFIDQLTGFFRFHEQHVPSKMEASKNLLQVGQGEVTFSRPERNGYISRHTGFVAHVLEEMGYKADNRQLPLSMERVERTVHGTPRRKQSLEKEVEADFPSWTEPDVAPGAPQLKGDAELQSIKTIYRAVRRNLWRHVLRQHRNCILSASRHLWWRMAGEQTASFCPVAESFIRWRMMWEGCGIPRYLFGTKRDELYGLVGWVAARPTPCPSHWSEETQLWVLQHIFACSCLESFRELLSIAQKNSERGRMFWFRSQYPTRYDTYWAVGGADCAERPTVVFVRSSMPAFLPPTMEGTRNAHRRSHEAQLSLIYR